MAWPTQRRQAGGRQALPAGDPQLPDGDVDAGEQLRHGVLDLQAGVHLDEREPAVAVDQELDGAGVDVVAGPAGAARGLGHRRAGGLVQRRAGPLLDQLLVPALHRAVALAQHQHAALTVGQHLHLDVAGLDDRLLEVHAAVPEGALGLGRRHPVGLLDLVRPGHHAHAAATAAGRRLQQHRVADLAGQLGRLGGTRQALLAARHQRHAGVAHGLLGAALVAHQLDRLGRRAHEHQVVVLAGAHEAGVLGQEPPAGMDGIAAGGLGGRDQVRHPQVAVGRRVRPDAHRAVGQAHPQPVAVGGRVHGHRLRAEVVAGAHQAHRRLPAVRDQDAARAQS